MVVTEPTKLKIAFYHAVGILSGAMIFGSGVGFTIGQIHADASIIDSKNQNISYEEAAQQNYDRNPIPYGLIGKAILGPGYHLAIYTNAPS